ncbi:MAG: tryptophan--tRNA ligase [Acidimicrobiia bacterium]
MARVLSGIQPSGELTLGSYLGALRRFGEGHVTDESFFCIVDLHAVTTPQDPARLRARTLETAGLYLASGLDPLTVTVFVQSHVPQHAELAWLMECTASFGELSRMTQFKDKSEGRDFVSAALFTYPALMAADILLYRADRVPVGDDQKQHLELARDLAARFNARYGEVFVVPEPDIPKIGARVMDLQEPRNKMSKSVASPQGTVLMLDPPATIERKFKRAVTDNDGEVRYDAATKPGVSNLLDILAACTGESPDVLAGKYSQYGPLKADTAAAVVELLGPVQARYAELAADPAHLHRVLRAGAEQARTVAGATLARAHDALGFLPR